MHSLGADPLLNRPLGNANALDEDRRAAESNNYRIPSKGQRLESRPLLHEFSDSDSDDWVDPDHDQDDSDDGDDYDGKGSHPSGSMSSRHRRKGIYQRTEPFPVRHALTSAFLLIAGIIFFCAFIYRKFISEDYTDTPLSEHSPFIFLAMIALIPGSYHAIIILFTLFGVPGYSYSMITEVQ